MLMIPITMPAAKADSDETSNERASPVLRKKGATVRAAKKP